MSDIKEKIIILENPKNLKIEDIKYWTWDNSVEILTQKNIDDAIDEYIEQSDLTVDEVKIHPLKLYGYISKQFDKEWFKSIVQSHIDQHISEEYMGEDGYEESEKGEEILNKFIEEYSETVQVWIADEVIKIEVDVNQFI